MGAPDEADQRLPRDRDARVKAAAAWAWYQRGGGSIAAGAGRSEVFATRCSSSPAPSRFQREAASIPRKHGSVASDATLFSSSSSLDNLLGSSSSLSHCTTFPGDIVTDSLEEAAFTDSILIPDLYESQPSLDLVSMDPGSSWDCGSSLFDSFELVTMSKKLDAELREPSIDGQVAEGAQPPFSEFGGCEPKFLLSDAPFTAMSPPDSPRSISPPSSFENEHASDIGDKLVAASDRQSKQDVYDMFCHYGDGVEHVSKQLSKRSPPTADTVCGGEMRKQKTRQGRMSFQALAKVLYSIKRLQVHATSGGGGSEDEEEIVSGHHLHHHLHYRPRPQVLATGKPGLAQGHCGSTKTTTPFGESHVREDITEGPQGKARHVHHHHHHHYHYLFHSDDDYRFQPPDKSLMVASAGLRSFKSIPALSNYLESPARGNPPLDFGGKLAEFGSAVLPLFSAST